jgi:hypothetical protein
MGILQAKTLKASFVRVKRDKDRAKIFINNIYIHAIL